MSLVEKGWEKRLVEMERERITNCIDDLQKIAADMREFAAAIRELHHLLAEHAEDTERIDKLQAIFEEHQYESDLALQSDEEDGIWFAAFYRHDTGIIRGISLDPTSTKAATVREAIDAIPNLARAKVKS